MSESSHRRRTSNHRQIPDDFGARTSRKSSSHGHHSRRSPSPRPLCLNSEEEEEEEEEELPLPTPRSMIAPIAPVPHTSPPAVSLQSPHPIQSPSLRHPNQPALTHQSLHSQAVVLPQPAIKVAASPSLDLDSDLSDLDEASIEHVITDKEQNSFSIFDWFSQYAVSSCCSFMPQLPEFIPTVNKKGQRDIKMKE